MHGITLNFVSLAALAAALPHLSQTPGLITVSGMPGETMVGNVVAPTAHSAPTASPAVAQETKVDGFAMTPTTPSYSFEQVKAALTTYNSRDAAAFGAAMQKFGFNSFDAIQAAPGSWAQLMSYIGADTPATPALTFEVVSNTLQTWSKINGATFQQAMIAAGMTSLDAVKAAPAKWPELMAAAKASGASPSA